MNMKILAAGAAGALLFGAVAIAQTYNNQPADQSAASADANASDTAAQDDAAAASEFGSDTAEGTTMDRAGERG